jgi:hypothetical protein
MEARPVEKNTVLAFEIDDSTGQRTVLFYGRSHIRWCRMRLAHHRPGMVGIHDGRPVMINPAYRLCVAPGMRRNRRSSRQAGPMVPYLRPWHELLPRGSVEPAAIPWL